MQDYAESTNPKYFYFYVHVFRPISLLLNFCWSQPLPSSPVQFFAEQLQVIESARKCTILKVKFKNFLWGYTPEPPLREGVEGDALPNPPPGRPPARRPPALRAYGRPTAAARPIVGTQTSRPPPWQNPGYALDARSTTRCRFSTTRFG